MKILTAVLAGCLMAPSAMAVIVGNDITLYDGQTSVNHPWYNNANVDAHLGRNFHEDNEVEPGTAHNDTWDLEGFYMRTIGGNNTLNMVGTFDPRRGLLDGDPDTGGNRDDYDSGDLFISNSLFPDGSLFDDLAVTWFLDLDWANSTPVSVNYAIYAVDANTVFTAPSFAAQSGPWRADGGTHLANGTASILSSTVSDHNLLGSNLVGPGQRWIVGFNWNQIANAIGLGEGDEFSLHFTMSCGNDALYGGSTNPRTPPIPEPASMALLGMGILGFAMRKRFTA